MLMLSFDALSTPSEAPAASVQSNRDLATFCRLGSEREIFQDGFEGIRPIQALNYSFFEPVPDLEPVGGAVLGNDWRLLESLTPDLNGDGRRDVVAFIGNELNFLGPDGPIQILFNNGDGGLTDCTESLFGGPAPRMDYPRDIHVSDFNGDGLPDLFFSNFGSEAVEPFPCEQNRLLLSTEAGGLVDATATHLPAIEDASHGSSIADVDLDGDFDIFVTNLGCQFPVRSYLMTNDGNGRFAVADGRPDGKTIFSNPFDIPGWSKFIDYDADGDDDLYVSIARGGINLPFKLSNLIIPNDGKGNFLIENAVTLPPLTQMCPGSDLVTGAQDARIVDWNGDGWPDITTFLSSCASPMIQILINDGEGGFRDETDQRVPFHGSAAGGAPRFSILDLDVNRLGHRKSLEFKITVIAIAAVVPSVDIKRIVSQQLGSRFGRSRQGQENQCYGSDPDKERVANIDSTHHALTPFAFDTYVVISEIRRQTRSSSRKVWFRSLPRTLTPVVRQRRRISMRHDALVKPGDGDTSLGEHTV